MKLTWTKAELQSARGCYSEDQIETLWNGGRGETVSLIEILESEINIRDKRWFFFNKAQLTLDQKKQLALSAAWVVLPIFEERRPGDKRPRLALEAVEKFSKGEISRDELRTAAYAADAYAYAAYAAYAYAYAADAAYAAAAAADAYAYAYAYAKNTTYSQRLQEAMIEIVKTESLTIKTVE